MALLPVPETVVVPVEVLELVTDPVVVGEQVSVSDTLVVRLGLRERRGVRETPIVPVCVGEADRVLLPPNVREPVAENVLVLEFDALAVSVLEPPVLRECVADPVGDFVVVIVRVPLVVAVPVLLAVVVAVEVTLRRTVCDWAGERDTVALPVELRDARVVRVSVGLALVVLEGAIERVGLGDALEVLDRLEDPVVVLDARTVAVVTAVGVVVFDPC